MTRDEIIQIFEQTGALRQGHFILSSGRHSKQYFQCAQVLRYPALAEKLCSQLAKHFVGDQIDLVIAPAVGGIVVAHEVARALAVPALFAEREQGKMSLRRNFVIAEEARVLVVEDVMTTGGSVREVVQLVRDSGAKPVAVGCLVDRSAGKIDLGLPYHALVSLPIASFAPDDPDLADLGEAVKPGSRDLK